jgi:hypothetical protein
MFDRLIGDELARKGGFGLAAFVEANVKARTEERQAADTKAELEKEGGPPRLRS